MATAPRRPPRPSDVLADSSLDRDSKRAILLEWLQDEQAVARAEGEGMQGERAPRLSEVRRALRLLEEADEA